MFDGFLNPFVGQSASGAGDADNSDSPFELGGGPDKLQGSRAERR